MPGEVEGRALTLAVYSIIVYFEFKMRMAVIFQKGLYFDLCLNKCH